MDFGKVRQWIYQKHDLIEEKMMFRSWILEK